MTYGSTAVYRFRPVIVNKLPTRFLQVIENPRDTYILLVEGADKPCYHPDFEWNRYLPGEVPSRVCSTTRHRIDVQILPFQVSLNHPHLPTRHPTTPPCYTTSRRARRQPPRRLKATKAKQLFIDAAKKYGDQTPEFMCFGMSARVSQALGLDIVRSEWIKSCLIEESGVLDRYWTFWTIFAQDINWSLYVGRDFCARGPTESDFKDMPVPFVDSEFDQMLFHHPPTNLPARPAYLSKNFASACELLVIGRIMAVVNGRSKTRIRASMIDKMISDIDLQLNTWKDSLPPKVDIAPKTRNMASPHQLMMHIAYWWFSILLHRPHSITKSPIRVQVSNSLMKNCAGNGLSSIRATRRNRHRMHDCLVPPTSLAPAVCTPIILSLDSGFLNNGITDVLHLNRFKLHSSSSSLALLPGND
ncbi:hypothetical protein BKA70DRAFT_1534784 [Coprinopsis sp. MPI-PUGE-AT-0042]|nr:hypothetical protein BKA70DRAFT_1534784 [Coprinopsis sp. MPI-PUGE-AT-0042]